MVQVLLADVFHLCRESEYYKVLEGILDPRGHLRGAHISTSVHGAWEHTLPAFIPILVGHMCDGFLGGDASGGSTARGG
jgi:hypothetical protein